MIVLQLSEGHTGIVKLIQYNIWYTNYTKVWQSILFYDSYVLNYVTD